MRFPNGLRVLRSLVTGINPYTWRFKVDSQQTSFEDNAQFRYFDRIIDISYNDQIVYKVVLQNPLNVFTRDLNIWKGGREYLVYPDHPNIQFTGILADSGSLAPLNSLLNKEVQTHPATTASIQRATGLAIFNDGGVKPITGTAVLTDGNANRASTEYDTDGVRLGTGGDTTLWIVMQPIGSNNNTDAHLTLCYEERFGE